MATAFNKIPNSITQHISLLQGRGLVINDTSSAAHHIAHIGYYRLAGYWQIFQTDPVKHIFASGTTFEQVIDFYNFDRHLRLLVYDGIERIEISWRSLIIDHMCLSYGRNWYTDEKYAQDLALFGENLDKIDDELNRSKEPFIIHHENKYGKTSYPPAWKTFQVLSFGTLSKIYSNLNTTLPEKNAIAHALGMPNYTYLVPWMQSISVLRNLCAHHSRISNRIFDFPPKKMATSHHPWITKLPLNMHQSQLLYNQLCSWKFLIDRVSPGNQFSHRLKTLVNGYAQMNFPTMGFPKDWEKERLWT